jgi:hypothetical protein
VELSVTVTVKGKERGREAERRPAKSKSKIEVPYEFEGRLSASCLPRVLTTMQLLKNLRHRHAVHIVSGCEIRLSLTEVFSKGSASQATLTGRQKARRKGFDGSIKIEQGSARM